VILTSIDVPEYDEIKLGVNIWNPNLNQDDCGHLMPIITPSFPQFNTSVNVTKTTLRIIKKEFKRAYVTLKKRSTDFAGTIKDLYQSFDITQEYNLYLRLELMADDPVNFHRWVG
jgi:poly(A) polymerase